MKPERLNALTDGVVAVIITLMVLELKAPDGASVAALRPWLPLFAVYALSFVNVGVYWTNHHHLMQSAPLVNGRVLWANLALLFWISLTPLLIRWIDEAGLRALPVATYGFVMLMAGLSYNLLEYTLELAEGPESSVRNLLGARSKERISLVAYAAAIGLAFISPLLAAGIYVVVVSLWFVPDRRFEQWK